LKIISRWLRASPKLKRPASLHSWPDIHPQRWDLTEDLREAVTSLEQLNKAELASVRKNVRAALSIYTGAWTPDPQNTPKAPTKPLEHRFG
jgi:hypothetical protein